MWVEYRQKVQTDTQVLLRVAFSRDQVLKQEVRSARRIEELAWDGCRRRREGLARWSHQARTQT